MHAAVSAELHARTPCSPIAALPTVIAALLKDVEDVAESPSVARCWSRRRPDGVALRLREESGAIGEEVVAGDPGPYRLLPREEPVGLSGASLNAAGAVGEGVGRTTTLRSAARMGR
jgi:hypothetical protein